jgi:flagellar biosynthesis/type III secretory pathway M-ring protein FliF/YscJ
MDIKFTLRKLRQNKIGMIIAFVIALGLFFLLYQLSRNTKSYRVRAEEEEIIQLKKELEIKTVSQLCAERGATSVSAFDNCVGGKSRISQNQENPLFFCCK